MATQDEEQALLGILESSLGDRQRAMNGLHLDQSTSLEVHREMLELTARVAEQTAVAELDQPTARRADRTSHRRPGPVSRWLQQRRGGLADTTATAPITATPALSPDPDTDTIDLRGLG